MNTKIPAEQLERLRTRFAQERGALVELAAADKRVGTARARLADAERLVKSAQAEKDAAYQRLVQMVGSATAKQLTDDAPPPRRAGQSEADGNGAQPRKRPVTA